MRYSAGVLVYRRRTEVEVLLGHMGGPLWARKDEGAWSIPKGEYEPGAEEPRAAAAREFTEELGVAVPAGEWLPLGEVRYSSGRKQLVVWAVAGDLDPAQVIPGTFEMEWPPRSGRLRRFPEIDRADWFDPAVARGKLSAGQRPLIDRLVELLAAD
ncbi:NUDIX domain-containing protein [Nocardia sp. NPDC051570]|uniref:NUDIX domain-containing protein n=1 Tax=Nocardia sp. NPDC051570 TaxID=3364324 RepID=UPI0037BCE5E5